MKYIISYLVIINVISFISMYVDKKKAIKNKWRISEKTFLIYTFLFGGVGVIGGMNMFRHKTKHLKFSLLIPIILTVQIIVIVMACCKIL